MLEDDESDEDLCFDLRVRPQPSQETIPGATYTDMMVDDMMFKSSTGEWERVKASITWEHLALQRRITESVNIYGLRNRSC